MIVLNEQSFRNFRSFYRSRVNGRAGRTFNIHDAAYTFLCKLNGYGHGGLLPGVPYLVNGPLCDGDTLILAGGESLQIEVLNTDADQTRGYPERIACSNRMISGV